MESRHGMPVARGRATEPTLEQLFSRKVYDTLGEAPSRCTLIINGMLRVDVEPNLRLGGLRHLSHFNGISVTTVALEHVWIAREVVVLATCEDPADHTRMHLERDEFDMDVPTRNIQVTALKQTRLAPPSANLLRFPVHLAQPRSPLTLAPLRTRYENLR